MPTNTPHHRTWFSTPCWLAELENQDVFPLRYLLQEGDKESGGYWPSYGRCMDEWSSDAGRLALYECKDPDPEEDEIEVTAGNATNGDYDGFGGIRRRPYESYMRNRDAACSS